MFANLGLTGCFLGQSTDIDPGRNNYRHDHCMHPSFTYYTGFIYSFQQHCICLCGWTIGVVRSGYRAALLATYHRQNSAFLRPRITAHKHARL